MRTTILKVLSSKRQLVVLLLGFSSGLPLILVGGTLKLWLKGEGIDIKTIGFFEWVGLAYAFKVLWAPFMDRYALPFLGRRRGWLLVSQLGLALTLFGMGMTRPSADLMPLVVLAVLAAFFSASQDVVVDAYRREILPDEELGLGASNGVLGYRIGMLVAMSLAPILSDHMTWQSVYQLMALFVAVGIATTLFCDEPKLGNVKPPRTLLASVVDPLRDYFTRPNALLLLTFILLFKVGDSIAGSILKPFYSEMGFSNSEIGAIAGPIGIWAAISGGIIGGIWMIRLGITKSLWSFGILQSVSTACFIFLARGDVAHPSAWVLGSVIFFEAFTGGMGTAAFVAFMGKLTNVQFTATQYALLTSVAAMPMRFLGGFSGVLKDAVGWEGFFLVCAAIAIPGLFLARRIAELETPKRKSSK